MANCCQGILNQTIILRSCDQAPSIISWNIKYIVHNNQCPEAPDIKTSAQKAGYITKKTKSDSENFLADLARYSREKSIPIIYITGPSSWEERFE